MADRVEVFESKLDDMPLQYARADVSVAPSLAHEGTSLSAIEGLVSGVPTVVSHIGGLPNIIIPGFNGAICDLTPESLAAAIQDVTKSRPLDRPGLLDACRNSLGKARWESSVWDHISRCLNLP
jgi:glycosyltransferase involved in cell wall biosynthesis